MSDEAPAERPELAAQFYRLSRALIAAEEPLLAARGIGMWEYVVLLALGSAGAPTQLELSRITGRDKTRLIGNLDALEVAGLVVRTPDPADRRARQVRITVAGRRVTSSCRSAIRRLDDDLMAGIPPADAEVFRRVLATLVTAAEVVGRSPSEAVPGRGAPAEGRKQ